MENLFNFSNDGLPQHLLLICVVFVIAGLVKGAIGLGLPTVAIGLLSLVMKPMEAAALLILPSFFTNIWQLAAGPDLKLLLRRLWPMLLGVCIGTFVAGLAFRQVNSRWSGMGLGLALIIYALMGMASIQWTVKANSERWLAPVIGTVTGMITAITGVFALPAVPFLQALKLEKDALVQSMGLGFTVSTVALAVNLAFAGSLDLSRAGNSLFALVPALAGMWLGQILRSKMNPVLFRRCFFAGLLGLGCHFFWGAIA
ncbi:sulfite exporter TauE/SafE family protein [Undibacterium sp. TJN19]|uniref:sulfite exporter TauE/SafE family protein n=1 Tax=Undibacterium sp. TJN19 TaxID=3413055 RepID=UPI003BF24613